MADVENKIFELESISDQNYQKLFSEIAECAMREWILQDGKKVPDLTHPTHPSYSRLDFIHLILFLKTKIGINKAKFLAQKNIFLIDWETFRHGEDRNVKPDKVARGIYTAAKASGTPLISLMAQLLQHCELNKIRLSSYAEYEQTIKNFLRDAPQLVEQLRIEESQILSNNCKKTTSEPTASKSNHGIKFVIGKSKWLDPYNQDELPFVGRKLELDQLNEFAEHKHQFKIWAIVGPSGAGKTRLAIHWAKELSESKNWKCHILHKEDRIKPKKWTKWLPSKPTLIIIDYIYGFDKVIQFLIPQRQNQDQQANRVEKSKVRLLVIDHIFSEVLYNDERWGFTGNQTSKNQIEDYFFKSEPLDLRQPPDQEIVIKSIITHRAPKNTPITQVDIAHEYLKDKKNQGAYHPLFAALVGDAMRSGEDFTKWNRRQLIDYYLSGSDRLPWENTINEKNKKISENLFASNFIAVATARGGISYDDLISVAGKFKSAPKNFNRVIKICQKTISNNNEDDLPSFKPDILGENFFLKFLHFLRYSPKYSNEFRQLFLAGNEKTQIKDALEFISFIKRLARNLLSDTEKNKETQSLWAVLFNFLQPADFVESEFLHWAVAVALIYATDTIKEQFSREQITCLLNKINPSIYYCVLKNDFLINSILASMLHFELKHNDIEKLPLLPIEIISLIERYAADENVLISPLAIASYYGFNKVINALLNHPNIYIDVQMNGGVTALMLASMRGHTKTVELLLDRGAYVDFPDLSLRTAITFAGEYGHTNIVKLLLDKGADIDAAGKDNKNALIYACINGDNDTVELLLDRGADINAYDSADNTGLIWACQNSHTEVVKLLVKREAYINAYNLMLDTPLSIAIENKNIEMIQFLADHNAKTVR